MGRKRGVGRKEGVEERALDVVEMLLWVSWCGREEEEEGFAEFHV